MTIPTRRKRENWGGLFELSRDHWSWGNKTTRNPLSPDEDPYSGRGIYLCGYLDVPRDYTNRSVDRIFAPAVAKFQVSGLALVSSLLNNAGPAPPAGSKSERTKVIEPVGPGGSGTSYLWRAAEEVTNRLRNGTFDVLGWDPRGLNAFLPAAACYPYDADRDR